MFPLSRLPWYGRWPAKLAVLLLAVVAVSFPYPGRLWTHLQHSRNPNALVQPDAPEIQPMVEELRPALSADLPPKQALETVQKRVHKALPYAWDWDTWGTADYIPTVQEAMAMGREDCDGRAVVAASVLRNLGYEAELVTDFTHVWVKTDKGETMGPRKNKAIVATADGPKVQKGFLKEMAPAVGFAIAVFPWPRELILLLVLWYLSLRPRGGFLCAMIGLALLLNGWLFLRLGGASARSPQVWVQQVGLLNVVAALALMVIWGRRRHGARAMRQEEESRGATGQAP